MEKILILFSFIAAFSILVILVLLLIKAVKKQRNQDAIDNASVSNTTNQEKVVSPNKSEHRTRMDNLEKKHESSTQFHDVQQPFLQCFQSLNYLETPYFTYKKHIDVLRENLKIIAALPQDDFFFKGKKRAINKAIELDYVLVFTSDMQNVFDSPTEFLSALDEWHKEKLLSSVDRLYSHWRSVVDQLNQHGAKEKRKTYVLDGFTTLKKELLLLKPTQDEVLIVENMIKRIGSEDWRYIKLDD